MILGFNIRFDQLILDKIKKHSIRLDIHGRWKAGNSIQYYNGVRTKNMRKFAPDDICKSVQKVKIKLYAPGHVMIYIDGKMPLFVEQSEQFVKNDGFETIEEFINWFFPGKRFGTFHGNIIHWTDLKY